MGIDLIGAGAAVDFSFSEWEHAQVLAWLHGWVPEGTYLNALAEASCQPAKTAPPRPRQH